MADETIFERHRVLLKLLGSESSFEFLGVQDLLQLHDQCIQLFGGTSGLRSFDLLDSATSNPMQLAAYGSDVNLARLAANLSYSLIQNHPFVDGNKRTAALALFQMLEINGVDSTRVLADCDVLNMVRGASSGAINEDVFYLSVYDCLSVRLDTSIDEPPAPRP